MIDVEEPQTLEGYLSDLSSVAPTPGGGSAASVVGACGAALVAMVARICAANPKFAERFTYAATLVHRCDGLRNQLAHARSEDEAAYAAVVAATALPRATDDEKRARTIAMQGALAGAATAPLQTATYACDVVRAACDALELDNAHLVSDLGCAAEFGAAALAAAAYSVRINHKFLKDADLIAGQARELEHLEATAKHALERVRAAASH